MTLHNTVGLYHPKKLQYAETWKVFYSSFAPICCVFPSVRFLFTQKNKSNQTAAQTATWERSLVKCVWGRSEKAENKILRNVGRATYVAAPPNHILIYTLASKYWFCSTWLRKTVQLRLAGMCLAVRSDRCRIRWPIQTALKARVLFLCLRHTSSVASADIWVFSSDLHKQIYFKSIEKTCLIQVN